MSQTRTIRVPLSKDVSSAISSDEWLSLVFSVCGPIDKLSTPVLAYPALFEQLALGKEGSVGPVVDFMSSNDPKSISARYLFYMITGFAVAANTYMQYKEIRKNKGSTIKINDSLNKTGKDSLDASLIPDKSLKSFILETARQQQYKVDTYQKLLNEPKNKFESVEIQETENGIELVYIYDLENRKQVEKKNSLTNWWIKYPWNKLLKPIWGSGGAAAFSFWCLGILAQTKLGGVPASPWFAIGIPALLAFPYIGLKIKHWFDHRGQGKNFEEMDENARLQKEAELETKKIYQKALHDFKYAYLFQVLEKLDGQQHNNKAQSIAKAPSMPLANASLTLSNEYLGNWSLTQYIAWYGTTFLDLTLAVAFAVPFGEVVGGAMIGIACVFGGVSALMRYNEAKAWQTSNNKAINRDPTLREVSLNEFEKSYKQKQEELKAILNNIDISRLPAPLQAKVAELNKNVAPKPKEGILARIRKSEWIAAWDTMMSGVFLSRLVLTPTAIFIPSMFVAAIAPWTLPVAIAGGFLFTFMKWRERVQMKRQAKLKEMPQKMLDLDQDLEIAKRTVGVLNNRRNGAVINMHQNVDSGSKPTRQPEFKNMVVSRPEEPLSPRRPQACAVS